MCSAWFLRMLSVEHLLHSRSCLKRQILGPNRRPSESECLCWALDSSFSQAPPFCHPKRSESMQKTLGTPQRGCAFKLFLPSMVRSVTRQEEETPGVCWLLVAHALALCCLWHCLVLQVCVVQVSNRTLMPELEEENGCVFLFHKKEL